MHWGWAYDGVNTTVPRNAGPECRNYMAPTRMLIECICVTLMCMYAIKRSWCNIVREKSLPDYNATTVATVIDPDKHRLYHQQTTVSTNNHNSSQTNNISSLSTTNTTTTVHHYYEIVPVVKQILLIVMTFILGLEMGFKLASRSVIYILNPCHITTMIQVCTN